MKIYFLFWPQLKILSKNVRIDPNFADLSVRNMNMLYSVMIQQRVRPQWDLVSLSWSAGIFLFQIVSCLFPNHSVLPFYLQVIPHKTVRSSRTALTHRKASSKVRTERFSLPRQWPVARHLQNTTIKSTVQDSLFSRCMLVVTVDRKLKSAPWFSVWERPARISLHTKIQATAVMHARQSVATSQSMLFDSQLSLPSLSAPDSHSWQAHSRDECQSFSSTAPSREYLSLVSINGFRNQGTLWAKRDLKATGSICLVSRVFLY